MRSITLIFLLTLTACATRAPTVEPVVFLRADGVGLSAAHVDTTVIRLMKAAEVHGLGLALIEGDRIGYLKAYGAASIEKGLPLQTDTVMYGASFTKAAFAYMVMTLVDDGLIDLDTPISEILPRPLPEFERYADLADDARWRVWTMRSLLSHTSGLPNWRWFSETGKLEILFEPGSRYAYSGEGIQIAQLTIEEGLGLDVNDLMQTRVFDRFGMTRTSMRWREEFRDNFARGYSRSGRNLGHDLRTEAQAAGSMDTTVADFAAFLVGVLNGEGLSTSARSEMLSAQVAITAKHQFPTQFPEDTDAHEAIGLSYGLGWGLYETPFGRAFFKEGNDDGTNNHALCLDDAKRCLLLLSNSANGHGIFLYLIDELMGKTNLPWEWEGYIPFDKASR